MSYRVGLSGGIGSGKSTVAALFAELGVPIIDSDAIAHALTQPGGVAIPLIRKVFGREYVTAEGALDRARMRELVFATARAKQELEGILHPLILSRMLEAAEAAGGAPYQILVVPLLFESAGFRGVVDRALVVDCAEETQIARAMARSALSRDTVLAIMAGQLPRSERLKRADDVIENDGSLQQLRPRVAALHRFYLDRSSGPAPR
ncbi:MAG TPA: dephospho-CoA kinase [Gallionellaceae bacterium]|nr:dephospho-CoA kinase [Gallionellaceae bacterium]